MAVARAVDAFARRAEATDSREALIVCRAVLSHRNLLEAGPTGAVTSDGAVRIRGAKGAAGLRRATRQARRAGRARLVACSYGRPIAFRHGHRRVAALSRNNPCCCRSGGRTGCPCLRPRRNQSRCNHPCCRWSHSERNGVVRVEPFWDISTLSFEPGQVAGLAAAARSLRRVAAARVDAVAGCAVHIDGDGAERELAGVGLGALHAAEQRAHARHQLVRAERLRHVVVGAEFEAGDTIAFVGLRGHHDDGNRGGLVVGTKRAADVEPGHAGQHQVENQQIDRVLLRVRQGLGARRHQPHRPAVPLDVARDQLPDVSIVFSDENLHDPPFPRLSARARGTPPPARPTSSS